MPCRANGVGQTLVTTVMTMCLDSGNKSMPKDFYSVWDRLASLRVKHEYAIAPDKVLLKGVAKPSVCV